MSKFNLSLLAAALLLAGCSTVGPNYQRPALDVPAALDLASGSTMDKVDLLSWWKSFQDPVLDALLNEAAANNQDLVLAAGRVEEARANAAAANANLYPGIDGNVALGRTRTSENAGTLPAGANPLSKSATIGLNASWEVDFWGKLSRADEAARARMLSQEANRGAVLNTLYANLAQNYFALRSFDAQRLLAQSALKTRQENLGLQQRRFDAGSIGELDLLSASAEVAATEVALAQAELAVSTSEAAIAVLAGRSPAAVAKPVIARGVSIKDLYENLVVPADLPSDLLNRRPDILAAEQALVAANADVGQARALYFPSLKLTTGVGYSSRVFSDLFNPAALMWNIGAGLTQPIFRAGAIGAVVAGAEARKAQATAQYVQTVQVAFRDVHDALNNISADAQIFSATKRRVAALNDALRLAGLRYSSGYSSYLEVLNAQRDLLQTESSLIDIQRAHLAALAGLYKAVGGGWDKPPGLAAR